MTDLKFYCKREHVSNETEFNASYSGGAYGIRTRDLLNAIQTRSQLR